jgi:hypothetical protein
VYSRLSFRRTVNSVECDRSATHSLSVFPRHSRECTMRLLVPGDPDAVRQYSRELADKTRSAEERLDGLRSLRILLTVFGSYLLVRRLQVAMNDVLFVRGFDAVDQLLDNRKRVAFGKSPWPISAV